MNFTDMHWIEDHYDLSVNCNSLKSFCASSLHLSLFVAFVEDSGILSSIFFLIFSETLEEVDPINMNFCLKDKCFDSTHIYN